MKVIKRDRHIVEYDSQKIAAAISKANGEVSKDEQASSDRIESIIRYIEDLGKSQISVEEIQDIIEEKLMAAGKYRLAKKYITYRYRRELVRKSNTTDESIKELIEGTNEYWNTENSNKNAKVVTTRRDYLAGITSTDITKRFLLPEDIVEAHDAGIIHFHDADYFARNALHNCDLIDLENMLQNGTNINGVMIEKPHRFSTAMTIATRLITAVASSQYGGATVTMTHLAPFVRDSYNYYLKLYRDRGFGEEDVKRYADEDLAKEITDGVQTFQYQINSMTTTNGQAPFLSVCLYLGETDEYKNELAMIIEEILKQRTKGMKNEKGVYITPAFPKLLYVLEEDNIHPDSKYWYLTELAAKCTAKRMVPDYISEKMMVKLKYPLEKFLLVSERRDRWGNEKIYGKNPFKDLNDEECQVLDSYVSESYDEKMRSARPSISDSLKSKAEEVMSEHDIDDSSLFPKKAYPCMGCVYGKEVVAYRFFGVEYVESFERMWNRISGYNRIRLQPNGTDRYIDIAEGTAEIYDRKQGFVPLYRLIRNRADSWLNVTLSDGRVLTCTPDHPFETENRGIVPAENLDSDDAIAIDNLTMISEGTEAYSPDRAWLNGVLLTTAIFQDNIQITLQKYDEDVERSITNIFFKEYGLDIDCIESHKGRKGSCREIAVRPGELEDKDIARLSSRFEAMFGGVSLSDRHIPGRAFSWNRKARLAFLAGMIDASGNIQRINDVPTVCLVSSNKEMAAQEVMLAQTLDMPAFLYRIQDRKKAACVQYKVEFVPGKDLMHYIVSKDKYVHVGIEHRPSVEEGMAVSNPIRIEPADIADYSYDVTTGSEHFTVSGIYSHNCRSFLTPDMVHYRTYGRFNQGVVTINLADVALSSGKDFDRFWKIYDERLELCHRTLQIRHKRLEGTASDAAPILWQHGALARLDKGERIDELLHNGYSTISLGYAGLYECVKYMTGHSHTDNGIGKKFGIEVMQKLNDKCAEWKAAENIDYSVYGTPIETTTYKFARCLQERFGKIEGITDRDYITNSYHVPVFEEIDAFEKLSLESEFQQLSPGGAVSYIETPNLTDNIDVVLEVIRFIYDNIMYAELNTKSDYCQVCGYDGEMLIDDNMEWYCPNCGNRDHSKLNVARRTCGYIGSNFWNKGRTQEIKERVLHIDNKDADL